MLYLFNINVKNIPFFNFTSSYPSLIKRTFQTQTNAIMAEFIRVFNAFIKRF
jgi:hypothetical protein